MYLLWPLYPSLPYRCKKDPGRGQPYPSYLAELSPGNLIPRPLLGLWIRRFIHRTTYRSHPQTWFFRSIRDCDRCRIGLFTGIGLSTTIATGSVYLFRLSGSGRIHPEILRRAYSGHHADALSYVSSCQNFKRLLRKRFKSHLCRPMYL